MLDVSKLKIGNQIKFIVTEGDYDTFWHFSSLGEYKVYDLQSAYPSSKLDELNELIIWCDEIDIHLVKYLNLEQWELMKEENQYE